MAPADPINHITFILGGASSPALTRIREHLDADAFWLNDAPELNEPVNGFGPQPPAWPAARSGSWHKIGPASVEVRHEERVPVDDWPFLYLRDRVVPTLNVRGLAIMAVLSVAVLFAFAPERRVRPNWRMFFMGAGFMLLESKSVVHLALLFGSTWMVSSIVFFAVLVMILLSNLFVLAAKPARLWPYYVLLAVSLLVGVLVPMHAFLDLAGAERVIVSCTSVFVPIFFAGIVFATTFRDSKAPDVDFGSNIAGAMLGGLSESLSLIVGFNYLLVLALMFYGLSAVWSTRGSGCR